MQLSKNVSLDKAIFSETAIRKGLSNSPNPTQIANMINVCQTIIEPLINRFGLNNIHINSFFRNDSVNKAVGGSASSQHKNGEAVDIDGLNDVDNIDIAEWSVKNIDFDQIIYEFKQSNGLWAWVHISTCVNKTKNRKIILEAKKINGKTVYVRVN